MRLIINVSLFLVISLFIVRVEVGGQGRAGLWEKYRIDSDRNLSSPSLRYERDEEKYNDNLKAWEEWWGNGAVGSHFPDIFENEVIPPTTGKMQLAAPLWGNPPFFCIDIPKMLYEAYVVDQNMNGNIVTKPLRKRDTWMDKFNKEGVGYNTQQNRSKSRYLNAYSLFWIMEPTSFRWNRRFTFRDHLRTRHGINVKPQNIGWTTREKAISTVSPFTNAIYDPYTDVTDGGPLSTRTLKWFKVMESEQDLMAATGLYWHVEVTGIREPNGSRILKGWYHLIITLRQTSGGITPVSRSQYSIDRLAVSARGLTFNHHFRNTGKDGFHSDFGSNVNSYFYYNYKGNRPHRVWEGGAGEFVRDFPKCKGVPDHGFAERQFVPCATTGKNQWYYGNNFILVNTDYEEYPDQSGIYGGGVIVNGDHEEVHLNYKLDQSFCNMYLAVDFVVNGVVITMNSGHNARLMDSEDWFTRAWLPGALEISHAIERSSSTRISFVVDDHVEDPQPIAPSCKNPALPLRQFTPPIIKQGSLPELTFYGNADPVPKGVDDELDCFVPLKPFNPAPNQPQPEESFNGAIQEIHPPETFTSATPRGLTVSSWYLYIRPWSNKVCVRDFRGDCQVYAEFSGLIRDQVKEWDWRKSDPSDFSELNPYKRRWEMTQVPYLDGTFKGFWVSYLDWVGDAIDPSVLNEVLDARLIRYGGDLAWPPSRQIGPHPIKFLIDYSILGYDGTIFQPLYFDPVPFVGRATADKSHQVVYSGVSPPQHQKITFSLYTPFSGEPGHSPPACDLYVSRYYLRILDPDDDQYYNKDVGLPNDPTDTCFVNTSRITTDPALQYVRKEYVKRRIQNPVRRPTWYEKYLQFDYGPFCDKAKQFLKSCPTMPPEPYTTPKMTTTEPGRVPTKSSLKKREANLRGFHMDNPLTLYIWDSRVIHGIWMTILAHLIFPLIILIDRFYGDAVLTGLRIYRMYKRWYDFRYFLALLIPPILMAGLQRQFQSRFILGTNYYKTAQVHWKAGWLVVFVTSVIATLWGTPLRNTRFMRQYGPLIKSYFLTVIKICNVMCMFTSIFIPGSPSAEFDVSDVQVTPSFVLGEHTVWLLFISVVFDIIALFFMIIWKLEFDYSDLPNLKKASRRSRYSVSPMPALYQHFKAIAQIKKKKKGMLHIYVFLSLVITLVMCNLVGTRNPVLGAPRGLGWMTCSHYNDGRVREMFAKNCPYI